MQSIKHDPANDGGIPISCLLTSASLHDSQVAIPLAEMTNRRRKAGYKLTEDIRYNEHSTVERVNGRLKDEFNARMVRVKGHAKVMAYLMFGIITLTADQLMRFLG